MINLYQDFLQVVVNDTFDQARVSLTNAIYGHVWWMHGSSHSAVENAERRKTFHPQKLALFEDCLS